MFSQYSRSKNSRWEQPRVRSRHNVAGEMSDADMQSMVKSSGGLLTFDHTSSNRQLIVATLNAYDLDSINDNHLLFVKQFLRDRLANSSENFMRVIRHCFECGFIGLIKDDPDWFDLLKNVILKDVENIDAIGGFSFLFNDTFNIYEGRKEEVTDNIKWLFDLCDTTPPLKLHLIEWLMHCDKLSPYMSATEIKRMEKMISEIDFPELKIRDGNNINLEDKPWFSFIKNFEKSKYLKTLINRVKINTEFSETPKNNSQIKPENFALGLPPFVSQSIGTINKPVIFDFSRLSPAMGSTIIGFFRDCKAGDKLLMNLARTGLITTDLAHSYQGFNCFDLKDFDTIVCAGLELFKAWLAYHKAENDTAVWRWFSSVDGVYSEQYSPFDVPNLTMWTDLAREYMVWPKESLRNAMKEPSAVVLQVEEISILWNEFIKILKDIIG